ncbi:hypothetical protein [Microbacterium sp. Marseille-Q6648]|uniref:hypothetical protein n=1 Tax=Microbacterium sp. Marseille-Q6648 TaxID=2937991 RepID=UPI00203AE2E8|nr:hypothetical protein [Microbacterium sp. Marseille-Q6648]
MNEHHTEDQPQGDQPHAEQPHAEQPHAEQPQAEQPQGDDAPTGGDQSTEDRLDADNAVEEDTLKALDPDAAPA